MNNQRTSWNKGSQERFLQKASVVHGATYDYSSTNYTNYHTKVEIVCKSHGSFLQKPAHHLAGIGCPSCGKERTRQKLSQGKDSYILLARSLHGDIYDYSLVEYKNRHTKVKIVCPIHGVWESSAHSHVSGDYCGCPSCSVTGFNKLKPASLYVLRSDDVVKIGITNRAPSTRAKEISTAYGHEFSIIRTFYFKLGRTAYEIERHLLRRLNESHDKPANKFNGSTECFIDVDVCKLLIEIENLMEAYV